MITVMKTTMIVYTKRLQLFNRHFADKVSSLDITDLFELLTMQPQVVASRFPLFEWVVSLEIDHHPRSKWM